MQRDYKNMLGVIWAMLHVDCSKLSSNCDSCRACDADRCDQGKHDLLRTAR